LNINYYQKIYQVQSLAQKFTSKRRGNMGRLSYPTQHPGKVMIL